MKNERKHKKKKNKIIKMAIAIKPENVKELKKKWVCGKYNLKTACI